MLLIILNSLENIADQNTKKVKGQYVTPEVLANLISLQAINDKNDLILDPFHVAVEQF